MDLHQQTLYDRLQHFRFDKDDRPALSFADRLARENEWTADYTQRVLREYRRFLLLCVAAGHPVTPSDAVDQAWHLHMIYTRSYWDRLCGETLGRPVHHGPTSGGAREQAKFHDWYAKTLDAYRGVFSEEPPRDIWPSSRERFAAARFVRVNRATHWVLPKPRLHKRLVGGAACLVVSLGIAGCAAEFTEDDAALALGIGGLVLAAAAIGFAAIKAARGAVRRHQHGSGCSGAHAGYMWHGGSDGKGSRNELDADGNSDAGGDGGAAGCGGGGDGGGGGCGGGGCGS